MSCDFYWVGAREDRAVKFTDSIQVSYTESNLFDSFLRDKQKFFLEVLCLYYELRGLY